MHPNPESVPPPTFYGGKDGAEDGKSKDNDKDKSDDNDRSDKVSKSEKTIKYYIRLYIPLIPYHTVPYKSYDILRYWYIISYRVRCCSR